jgi:hypothetical protein
VRNAGFGARSEQGPQSQIASALRIYRGRIRRQRRKQYLAYAALALGALWVAAALLTYLDLAPAGVGPLLLGLSVLVPAGALALEALRRPSLPQTAELVDRALDDKQRMVTALELTGHPQTRPLAQAQLASTAALLGRADPRAVYPARTPWAYFVLGAGLLLIALSLFVFKGVGDVFALQPGSLPDDQQAAAALASPTQTGRRAAGSSSRGASPVTTRTKTPPTPSARPKSRGRRRRRWRGSVAPSTSRA